MKRICIALVVGLALTEWTPAEAGSYDPDAVTCAEYSQVDAFGIKVIPNHQRQDLAVFAIGYVVGEAGSQLSKDDQELRHAADLLDRLCSDAKHASATLIEIVKQYLTLAGKP